MNFLENEFQLISSYFDLPGNEKSTSRGVFPFFFPRKKEKRNSETLVYFWFLLSTGRMPHPVGGAMGVTLCHCREKGNTHFDIISLNIDKTT